MFLSSCLLLFGILFSCGNAISNQDISYNTLQNVSISPINLWTCTDCVPEVLPKTVVASPNYSWGVILVCGACSTSRMVCKECKWVRAHFISAADFLGHHRHKHHNTLTQCATVGTMVQPPCPPQDCYRCSCLIWVVVLRQCLIVHFLLQWFQLPTLHCRILLCAVHAMYPMP